MVEKVKQECIELINESNDFELIDLIWRLLLKSVDKELSPEVTAESEDLKKWQKRVNRKKN